MLSFVKTNLYHFRVLQIILKEAEILNVSLYDHNSILRIVGKSSKLYPLPENNILLFVY